jgi:hypothetical protein
MTCLRIGVSTFEDRLANADLAIPDFLEYAEIISSVGVANGYIFLFGSQEILVSQDGVNFIGTGMGFTGYDKIHAVAYGNGVYVLVGDAGQIYTSTGPGAGPDFDWGWVTRTPGDSYTGALYDVVFDGTRFIAVGDDSVGDKAEIQRSTDGITWEHVDSATLSGVSPISILHSIAAGNGVLVAAGLKEDDAEEFPHVQLSDDGGATWTEETLDGLTTPDVMISEQSRVIFTGAFFIFACDVDVATVAKGAYLQQSSDGEAWTDISDKLVTPSLAGSLPNGQEGYPVGLHHDSGKLVLLHEHGDLQLSRWNGTAFGDFTRIPFGNFVWIGIAVIGNNWLFMAPASLGMATDPALPLPPPPT